MNEEIITGSDKSALYESAVRSEINEWFSVSGDMDDFIFYDAPDRIISEK